MQSAEELRNILKRIDHRGYPAYKDTRGRYEWDNYHLSIDHVQSDPFASPSKVSIHIKGNVAGFPQDYYRDSVKRAALQDHLLRRFYKELERVSFKAKGSGKSGLMSVSRCGQEVLLRSACQVTEEAGDVLLRMEIGFPANGRTVNAGELEKILFDYLPQCVKKALYYKSLNSKELQRDVELSVNQKAIRDQLDGLSLAAFVANGAILPRESGISGRPMKDAVAFRSPKSMEVTLKLPYGGSITGMGIKKGITLIVGGGYHGKSTLLKALELGVYNHVAGDGREYVITDAGAVKVRAEDGRSIKNVDISMFIRDLPNGRDTSSFYTQDASGSTSQAANVAEAMEAGTKLLLMDEDTSATNFMIRDELMQRVVHRDAEPIIPFIDRVEELYRDHGISTILVAGSSGSYFHRADCILQMNRYLPEDITSYAKKEAESFPILKGLEDKGELPDYSRVIKPDKRWREDARIKMKTMGKDYLSIDKENIELRYVEQLVDEEQLRALGYLVKYACGRYANGKNTIQDVAELLWKQLEEKGFLAIFSESGLPGNLAMPRKQEFFACINRFRMLDI